MYKQTSRFPLISIDSFKKLFHDFSRILRDIFMHFPSVKVHKNVSYADSA